MGSGLDLWRKALKVGANPTATIGAKALHGMARPGTVRSGEARSGLVMRCLVVWGMALSGRARFGAVIRGHMALGASGGFDSRRHVWPVMGFW